MKINPFFVVSQQTINVAGIFLVLVIIANLFTVCFITQEHYIYYWDWAGYWLKYMDLSTSLSHQPMNTLDSLINSVRNDDYNPLPVLPLVPFAWLFGTSRLTYILAITNVALLPSVFIITVLAQRVLSQQFSRSSFILISTSVLMLHALWVPVLRGMPDVLGILVIGNILLRLFAQPFAEQKLSHLVTIGLLLCLLVLIRRWYAFWVVSFFPALAVVQCLDIYQHHGVVWRQYINTIRNIIIIGMTFSIALFTIATPLMLRILHTDYADIYSAYKSSHSLLESAEKLIPYFGWGVIICGLSGLVWLVTRKDTRVVGSFLITQLFIVFGLFLRTQDFGMQHYYLLMPAIGLGIAVMLIGLWTQINNKLWRLISVGFVFVVLITSFITAFIPKASNVSNILGSFVPQARFYPFIRHDMDELARLLNHLNKLEARQQGDIYMLASSFTLNSEILDVACRFSTQQWDFCDHLLNTNDVDKRDGFPRQFLHAHYLVVASPVQYHLRAEDQRVVGVLLREVMKKQGIGSSFQRLPDEFRLDNEITVWIYEKVKPFDSADLDALANEFVGYYPHLRHVFSITDEK
jgi:hypothetical protein